MSFLRLARLGSPLRILRDVKKNAVSTTTYDRVAWARGYETLREEMDYCLPGTVPADLTGTLWRNGPGQLDLGGVPYRHPFDGDGMVCALTFKDGRVHFRNRYVRTEGFVQEQAAGRILFKNVFGTLRPGGMLANWFDFSNKNVANTGVVYYADKLWALWEAAPPHRLNPHSLETVGLDKFLGELPFSAHPRFDPLTGHLWNFGVEVGLASRLHLYELDRTGRVVSHRVETLKGFAFIHDFVLTPHYAIFFQNPMALDPWPFVWGQKGAGECLNFAAGEPTRILVMPRAGGPMVTLTADPFFVFHHANGFEQDGLIQVDSVRYEEYLKAPEDKDFRTLGFDELPGGKLWRTTLNVVSRQVTTRCLGDRMGEFPAVAVAGLPQRDIYWGTADCLQNGPLQVVCRLNTQTGQEDRYSFAPTGFVGEPVVIPSATGGWVISLVYQSDVHRTAVAIFAAEQIAAGPVALLPLAHHLPYGLHGSWSPGFLSDTQS